MPYEPTPIIIYPDPQADPPVIQDQNTTAWGKANTNFEDIAEALEITLGALQYHGVWDCSTTAYPSTPSTGDYYACSVEGTISGTLYRVNDWLVYNGATWDKIDNATLVTSVAGRTGAVTLTTVDVADSSDKRYCSDAQKTVIGNTSGTNSGNETTTTVGSLINGATAKTAPVDADYLGLMDSESTEPANVLKKLSWAYVKSVLKTYFDGLYTLSNLGGVPTSRTVAGHALTDNVSVSASDVGLGNVSNVAQMPASYLDTDNTLNANSDAKVPSQKAVKTYTDTGLGTKAATGHNHDSAYTAASHASAASPHSGHENTANKAVASGYASLDASILVVQNPANAQTTSAPSKIPIADLNGSVDDFVTPFAIDINANQLEMDFIPANYTPTVTPSCETTIQLAAQLKGIDLALTGILDRLTAHSI